MINGVVEAKSNKFDKYSVLVGGAWYSSKFEIKAEKGDTVEFDNGGEGKKYCSKLKVVSKGSGGGSAEASTVSSGTATKPAYSRGSFPVPKLDGSRAIIRQNAVTNANAFFGNLGSEYSAEDLVAMARKIEAYTTGDIEAAVVADKIAGEFDPEA